MTQEQQDAIMMRLIRSISDLKVRKVALETQVGLWQKQLSAAALALQHIPAVAAKPLAADALEYPDAATVRAGADELRQVTEELYEGMHKLREAGINLS